MNLPSLRMREAVIATILFGIGGLLLLPRDAPPSASPAPPEVSLVSHQSSHSVDGVNFIPIKSIRVGQRVWVAEEAPGDGDLEFGEDVIAAQWRKMVLRCPKRDGTTAHVEMLRPAWWLVERDVAAGGTVDIDVPECGISGRADILAVEACPPIALGPGRVVTSTFHHQATATIDITIEGMEEPIGSTSNHPIWSETEQDFVRADALRPGEQVRTLAGLAQVVAITPRGPPEPVYNLEVQVDHVFHVGTDGVLVHNALIPFYTQCMEQVVVDNIKASEALRKLHPDDADVFDDALVRGKPSGSYVHTFENGEYVGKGLEQRATKSAREVAERTGDKLIETKWESAVDEAQALRDEARKIRQRGGIRNLYNRRNSPGEGLLDG